MALPAGWCELYTQTVDGDLAPANTEWDVPWESEEEAQDEWDEWEWDT